MSLLDEIKKRAQSAVKTYTQQDDVQKRLNDYAASNKVSTYSDVKNTVKQAFQPVLNIVDNVRSKPAENWYKGDQPTRRETLARIYDISNEDASRGETLFNMYEAELSDPTSPFYNPYTQATTSKANKTNLANTAKAQEEWARLSDELSYWATRSDRNYSDDEIIARIDWDNYKTLQKMDEGRKTGNPLALLDAVDYSEDAMYGVLWAARNPDAATGDAMMDAAQSALGRGNQYKRDEGIANKLDPTNASYNPYTVGSTVDDLAYKYGVNSFDDKWLEDHRDLLLDPDTAKDYGKIYGAVQDTNAFQAESAAFKEELARYAEKGVLPDYDYLLQQPEYKNLAKLQESLKSGQIMDTASAIDFDLPTLKAESEAAYALKQAQLNAGKDPAALETAVEAEKQSWFQRIGARASEWLSGWFKDDPIPESETSKPDTLYDEDPAASLVGGMMWAGASSPRAVSDEQRQRMLMMSGDLPLPEPDTVPEPVDESIGGAMSDEQRHRLQMMSGDLPLPEPEPVPPVQASENEHSMREILTAIEEGDYTLAAGLNYANIMRKLEEDPELLVTDNAQKAILLSLALVGELGTPEAQEAAQEYAVAAETSMGLDTSNAVYGFIDDSFGGALSETSDNEGVGFWRTVQYALMSGGDKFNDVLANIAGTVVTGYGYAVEGVNKVMNWLGVEGTIPMAEKLQQAGADVANYYDEKLQAQEQFMRENATTAEYLGYTAGSEAVKMAGMGTVAQGIGAAAGSVDKVATALEANKLATATKLLTMSPFVAESASAEFQDSIQKSDNFLTSVLSASIVGFATMATSDVGVLKNIEKMGKGALPEIVDALASVPGVGVKAAAKRWGKGMLMYMGNLIKTGINEGFQEAFENVLGTSATAGLKGEEFKFDREYVAELTRDAIMGAIGSFSSSIGVMPNYAESVIVANANAHKSVLTPADVKAQMDAFANDLNNPEVMDIAKTAAAELAVGARTGELVAQGALGEIDTSSVDNAAAKLAEAEPAEQAANEAVARADEKFKANMADDAAANELMSAIDAQSNAQKAADDARAELAAAQAEQAAAATEAMNAVREQARAEVTQNMAAVQEDRLQQEAAAEAQRQNDNVLALQADDFVNEYMANAPDDVKDQVRERYMAYDGETQNATRGMVEFASQISKKFNLNITFTDSHGIFEGAYKGGNTIILDKNATQGEVIQRVLVHEITHAAESSKAYDALADAVLSAYYEGNTDQMNADLATIAQQYSEQAGQDGQSVSRSELVAQRLSEMLSGNQDALNRLVAEKPDVATRIWRAIKEFIGKLRGVRDPELDKLMKLEKQLEKALGSRTDDGATRFSLTDSKGDVVTLSQEEIDGNKRTVANQNPIIALEGNSFAKNEEKDFETMATEYFAEVGNTAQNPILGEVRIGSAGIKHLIGQKLTSRKTALLPAIKPVIENGSLIHIEENHKGKGFDSGLIAATVTLDGKDYYMGVVIRQTNPNDNSYYMHDAVLVQKNRASAPNKSGQGATPAAGGNNPTIASILSGLADYNGKFGQDEGQKAGGARFSLPSNDILDQQIAQHRNSQLAPAQSYGDGERQFAGQTIQNSAVVPDWIKQEFLRPEELNYETDTNREQVERSWQRIQENGYESERDRLLSIDRYSADDTAEANLMMAMALREDTADPATFMALASHYNKEGTKAGQELQARKLFTRMSPTGARVWAAGQMESNLEEHMRTHRPQRRRIDDAAREVADQIRDMQDGDELLRLNAGGDFTIDESNNRWGIPINEQQQALIDHYGLNNVARPGIFYNRATTKQRMLEAILATPNPLEVTGLGLNLIQRLEYMQDGEAVITNADLNYIGTQLGQFVSQGGDEGGREADLAVARAYEAYGNITPSTTREKLRTWRYVSMLLSVPSAIRNVIGNASQNIVNATAHGIAVELDKAIARATGQRTVAHLNYQERIDGWRGFVEETQNTFRDYFIDRSVTRRGNDKYNTNQRGRVYQTQFIETMRNMEGFLMSFGDRNTWRKAYLNSMAEQQKLADRNLLFNDDGTTRTHEQMLEQAEADANYATFTEDNAVSNVLSQLKNIPGVGEVIDFIMPFTGVPANITRRMIQYSPIGLAATALRHGYRAATHKNFDQRAFVDGISRGLTGTALFGVGMLLAATGVIKPGTGDEDDDKKYGLKTAMGGQYTPYVYNPLTGEYVSLAAFAPAASPLTMGLAAYEELKNNDDALQAIVSTCFSGLDQIFDASYMSGIQDIFKGYGSPAENITNAVFSNAVSQSVPALLTQLSNTIDPYVRDTKDKNAILQALKSGLINRIPGLRQMLPEKVDVTGQTVRTKEGLRNFYDPFTTTDARKDPAVDELFRLSEALGSSSMLPRDELSGSKMTLTVPSNGKVTVDAEGKETYRKRYGELWLEGGTTIDKKGRPVVVEGVRSLINSSAYQMMDDEERSDAIADIIYEAKIGAMMEALNKYGAD